MKLTNSLYLIFCIVFIPILSSCDFESDDLILDETDGINYKLYDQYIDKYGNKGVVAFVSNKKISSSKLGNKYIIVISADESTLRWGEMNNTVIKSDSIGQQEIYTHKYGIGVLQLMISTGIENYPAQNWCHLKNHSEVYSGSWHLPTHYELKTLLLNKVQNINSVLNKMNGDLIDEDALFWTCVEDYPNYNIMDSETDDFYTYEPDNRAIPITPKNKTYSDKTKWNKNNEYRVRAIKFIYYGK